MRHGRRGRKLGRTASHKRAMLSNMATSLFAHGSVRTTCPKGKELRGVAERLITFAKRGDLHARRQVLKRIHNKVVVSKLFEEIGPAFTDRAGGYTRLLKLGPRRGDSSEMCLVELVGEELRADYAERSSSRLERASAESAGSEVEAQEPVAPEEEAEDSTTESDVPAEEGEAAEPADAQEGDASKKEGM